VRFLVVCFFSLLSGCSGFFYHCSLGVANKTDEPITISVYQEYSDYVWENNSRVTLICGGENYVIDQGGVTVRRLEPNESTVLLFSNFRSDFSQTVIVSVVSDSGKEGRRNFLIPSVYHNPYQRSWEWVVSDYEWTDFFGW